MTAQQPPYRPENRAQQIQGPPSVTMSASPPPGQIPPPSLRPSTGPYSWQPTNTLAIWSLVCAFAFPALGVIFGHVALRQIKRSGQDGYGLAVAGLVCGYSMTVVAVAAIVFVIYALYAWFMVWLVTLQWVPLKPTG